MQGKPGKARGRKEESSFFGKKEAKKLLTLGVRLFGMPDIVPIWNN
jgi:hypothetical protein